MKYTQEELEIMEAIESDKAERVPFDPKYLSAMAEETLDYINEKKQISINLKKSDLDYIKTKARDIGISYQNIIQTLVHNYAKNKVEIKI